MGLLTRWRTVRDVAMTAAAPPASFAVDRYAIDPALFGMDAWPDQALTGRVSRRQAMSVPAVKRARDLIAGTISGLPLYVIDGQNQRTSSALLEQPEADRPRSATIAQTVEDLLFEAVAVWRVVEFDWTTYPRRVKRLDPAEITINDDGVWHGGKRIPDSELIRFWGPSDPLLVAGARAIRMALVLDDAARRYADEPAPAGWFTPTEGADPVGDDDVLDLLGAWKTARQSRSTAYIPAALSYHPGEMISPKDLQLVEARQYCALEISRLTGIDAEELGVSTTSRTYFNSVDRRMAFQDMVLGPFVTAVTDRLSMGDVTPRGYRVKADFSGFTRSAESERLGTYEVAARLGLYGLDEMARREELPAPTASSDAVAPVQEDAP